MKVATQYIRELVHGHRVTVGRDSYYGPLACRYTSWIYRSGTLCFLHLLERLWVYLHILERYAIPSSLLRLGLFEHKPLCKGLDCVFLIFWTFTMYIFALEISLLH